MRSRRRHGKREPDDQQDVARLRRPDLEHDDHQACARQQDVLEKQPDCLPLHAAPFSLCRNVYSAIQMQVNCDLTCADTAVP